ncbi:MAG: threonine synthase [Pseudomonadota bacterium]
MRYISTRGQSPEADFPDVLTRALAPDGGLYVPKEWPAPLDMDALRGQPFAQVSAKILKLFAGDSMTEDEARALTDAAYATFRHEEACPVVPLWGEDHLLELFHGPTLAFKDVAMQLIARLFERDLAQRGGHMTVIVATSGDTGGAAVSALANRENLKIVSLHPHNRISEVQRRFMTTSGANNVLNLAVHGTFDDCQSAVKALFADRPFAEDVALGGVNSINWARIAAQVTYYVTASLALDKDGPVHFSVPTGNFGDVFAGYVAQRLGAPVGQLIVAVNENDILDRALKTGTYEKKGITQTEAPSMDIEVASNFERLIFEASHRDDQLTLALMESLKTTGSFSLPREVLDVMRGGFSSARAGADDIAAEMKRAQERTGMILDPHTAIGLHASRLAREEGLQGPLVTLATAHAAKFPNVVEEVTGHRPALPFAHDALYEEPEVYQEIPNDLAAMKTAIRGC